jgi:hypothetical protein
VDHHIHKPSDGEPKQGAYFNQEAEHGGYQDLSDRGVTTTPEAVFNGPGSIVRPGDSEFRKSSDERNRPWLRLASSQSAATVNLVEKLSEIR